MIKKKYWQCDLWFLCLFGTQLVHLQVLSSHTAEASSMRDFEHTLLACEMSTIVVGTFCGIALLWDWNEN